MPKLTMLSPKEDTWYNAFEYIPPKDECYSEESIQVWVTDGSKTDYGYYQYDSKTWIWVDYKGTPYIGGKVTHWMIFQVDRKKPKLPKDKKPNYIATASFEQLWQSLKYREPASLYCKDGKVRRITPKGIVAVENDKDLYYLYFGPHKRVCVKVVAVPWEKES